MKKYKQSPAIRSTLFFASLIIWFGIWLTGFAVAHWLLYVPAVMLGFAGITGICPGAIFFKTIYREE